MIIFNIWDPPGQKQNESIYSHFYEWRYLDKDGKRKTDKRNVYMYIQSQDYTYDIEECYEKHLRGEGIYVDTTSIQSFDDAKALLVYRKHLEEVIKNLEAKSAKEVDDGTVAKKGKDTE